MKDIDGGFPSNTHPYTDYYDYTSDSDLEDKSSCSEEEYEGTHEDDNPEPLSSPRDSDSQVPSTTPLEHSPQAPPGVNEVQTNDE